MRAIRTETYFLESDLFKPADRLIPAISFVWFKASDKPSREADDIIRLLKGGHLSGSTDEINGFLVRSVLERAEASSTESGQRPADMAIHSALQTTGRFS